MLQRLPSSRANRRLRHMNHSPLIATDDLQARIRTQIPLARAIDLAIGTCDGNRLVMHAPLAPNINDKGCAFGGSLASVMTLAGWSLVTLALEQRDLACDVFVGRSEVAYLSPVWSDFQAIAELDVDADWAAFFATLARRGKARIAVACHVRERDADARCATLTAQFVAKRRDGDPDKASPHAAQ